jgi:hypothetical protein
MLKPPEDVLMTDLELRRLVGTRMHDGKRKPADRRTTKRWRDAGWLPFTKVFGRIRYHTIHIDFLFGITQAEQQVDLMQTRYTAEERGRVLQGLIKSGTIDKWTRERKLREGLQKITEELKEHIK